MCVCIYIYIYIYIFKHTFCLLATWLTWSIRPGSNPKVLRVGVETSLIARAKLESLGTRLGSNHLRKIYPILIIFTEKIFREFNFRSFIQLKNIFRTKNSLFTLHYNIHFSVITHFILKYDFLLYIKMYACYVHSVSYTHLTLPTKRIV